MGAPQPYQLVRRVHQAATYEIWEARSVSGTTVTLVILTAPQPAARAAFADAVRWGLSGDVPEVAVAASDLAGPAPWVALLPDRLGRGVYRFIDQLQLADRTARTPWSPAPMSPPAPLPASAQVWRDSSQPAVAPWVSSDGPALASLAAPAAPWSPAPPASSIEWSARRRRRPALLVVLLATVVVVLLAGAAVWLLRPGRTPSAAGRTPPAPAPPHPSFRASATPTAVLGDNWEPGDATKVQAFAGWPFAFRTPAAVTCTFYVGEPDYKAMNCEWGTGAQHAIMAYVVRRCGNGCDAGERARFETMTPWRPDTTLADKDATTRFGEVNYGGREQFTMLHYFAVPAGPALQWVTIVQGNCPVEDRQRVLKTINDIRSQTP